MGEDDMLRIQGIAFIGRGVFGNQFLRLHPVARQQGSIGDAVAMRVIAIAKGPLDDRAAQLLRRGSCPEILRSKVQPSQRRRQPDRAADKSKAGMRGLEMREWALAEMGFKVVLQRWFWRLPAAPALAPADHGGVLDPARRDLKAFVPVKRLRGAAGRHP